MASGSLTLDQKRLRNAARGPSTCSSHIERQAGRDCLEVTKSSRI